jgi:fucose 4-O-acetylase-like acetyltransferase
MDKETSNIINWMRFPLACLIVIKHYYTPDISAENIGSKLNENLPFYYYIGEFFTHIFTAIPVPLFFFISGYLYFINSRDKKFEYLDWKIRTVKRFRSLLIPYLSWNLLVLLLFAIMQFASNQSEVLSKEGYKMIADYNIYDYFKAFYCIDSTGMPIDGPLWFIRDLFIVSILSPLIYMLIKYTRFYGIIAIGVFYFFGMRITIPGFDIVCLFFFSWGAYLGLNNKKLAIESSKFNFILSATIILLLLTFYALSYFNNYGITDYARSTYIIVTVYFIFYFLSWFEKKGFLIIPDFLSVASFFIFAIHKPIQVIVRRLVFSAFDIKSDFILSSFVVLIPIIVIFASLGIFYCVRKFFPFLRFLNGFRL